MTEAEIQAHLALADETRRTRDSKRPTMKMVADVMQRAFANISVDVLDLRQSETGPRRWSWLDATGHEIGYAKWFILTESDMDDALGFPLLTIRQSLAPLLDCWVSFSQLITGLEEGEIAASLALVMANHTCAIDGTRMGISEMLADSADVQEHFDDIIERIDPDGVIMGTDKPPKDGWN